MNEALIELRSNLFSGIEIDVKDTKIIKKFKRDFPGVDLDKALDIAKKQIQPLEFNGLLFLNIATYHQAILEVRQINTEFPELKLDAPPTPAFSYMLSAFTAPSVDIGKVQQCCDHFDKRAKIAENKGRTESAGFVRQFSADCRKYLTDSRFTTIRPIFGQAYSAVISEISKIKGGTLGIIQLRDLAEKCFTLTNSANNDITSFQLVMLLIELQCKDFKMEMPIASSSTVCPFCDEKVTDGNVCENCREYIKCPGCGAKLTKKGTCSGCGIDTSKIKESVLLLDEVEKLIGAGHLTNLENRLKFVFTHWKKNERVIAITESIDKVKSDIATQAKIIDVHLAKLQYKSALSIIDELIGKNDSPLLLQKKEQVTSKIRDAEQLLKQGDASSDWSMKLNLYKKALQLCTDLSEATRNLENLSIQAPSNLNAEVQGKVVRLQWVGFNSPHIKYVVVRKENGLPENCDDGERLATIDAERYDDVNAITGQSYYYAIYCLCAYTSSKDSATAGPILVVEDIDIKSFQYDIHENNIGLSFSVPKNSISIDVYRDNGIIKTLSGNTFVDSNLTTDKRYKYRFVTTYQDCLGKKCTSQGIEIEVVPTSPPKPIDLKVSDLTNKTILTWIPPAKGILELYYSDRPFIENKNDNVIKEKIQGEKIAIVGNSCTIIKNYNGVRYYLPITISGDICIAGTPISIVSILKPEGVSFDNVGERSIEVSWQWIKGIESVKLSYSIEGGREQSEIINKTGTPNAKKTITLPKEAKGADIYIQTQITDSNNNIILSQAVKQSFSLQIAKISFLDVSGGGLFSRSKFTIKVQSNANLPCDLHLLIGEGITPIDINNYKPHLTIDKSSLSADKPKSFTFQYVRDYKSKVLIFRLIPSDMSMSKSLVITPETRLIK